MPLMDNMEYEVLRRIQRTPKCWIWMGRIRHTSHYGVLANRYPHRIVYELYKGPIREGLQIDHLCRNRLCVNPAHLEAVTQRVNILRGEGVSALHAKVTHCPRGHAYSVHGWSSRTRNSRQCKICKAAVKERWRQQRRNAGLAVS